MFFSILKYEYIVLVKRHTELLLYLDILQDNPAGRGYKIKDLYLIKLLGVSSAISSLIIFGLYISAPKVQALYTTPVYLWAILLLGFLWVLNLIVTSNKGEMQHDPIVFAFTNKISLVIFFLSLILIVISI